MATAVYSTGHKSQTLKRLMTFIRRFGIACFALLGASEIRAQDQAGIAAFGLNAGDQVRITVWRKPELSGDFSVAPNGTLTHPLYREVQVTGVPMSVVEDRLRTFLARYETNPQFVIQPLVKVIVGGEVRNPNLLSVPPETTIAQAIALAGGPTERGLLNKVLVIRDRQEIRTDLSRPDSDVGVLQVRSGDQVLVGRRGIQMREYISPISSSIAAVVAIVTLLTR